MSSPRRICDWYVTCNFDYLIAVVISLREFRSTTNTLCPFAREFNFWCLFSPLERCLRLRTPTFCPLKERCDDFRVWWRANDEICSSPIMSPCFRMKRRYS
jgi:hypothetical protein